MLWPSGQSLCIQSPGVQFIYLAKELHNSVEIPVLKRQNVNLLCKAYKSSPNAVLLGLPRVAKSHIRTFHLV